MTMNINTETDIKITHIGYTCSINEQAQRDSYYDVKAALRACASPVEYGAFLLCSQGRGGQKYG